MGISEGLQGFKIGSNCRLYHFGRFGNPQFQTFGASANAITIKVFNRRETIGNFALSKLEAFKQRLAADEDPDTLIDEANAELGDSVEKVLFVNQALNKKEGK